MENISIKEELKILIQNGEKTVLINGWKESIEYVKTLHLYSLTRIGKGVYQSNPK